MKEICVPLTGMDDLGNIAHQFQLRLAVKVIILSKEGLYLTLLRSKKNPVSSLWDIPGGRMKYGETPIDALIREVKEEVGINIASEAIFPIKAWCIKSGEIYVIGIDFFCIAEKTQRFKISPEHLSANWIDREKIMKNKTAPSWLKESIKIVESLKNGYLKLKEKEEDEDLQGLRPEKQPSFTIEGIDGAGKTTQALELVNWLNEKNKNKGFYAKAPQGSALGEKIMELANDLEAPYQVEMMAFLLSNMVFYKEIVIPRIAKGEIVVFDRWTGSFMNYFNLIFNICYNSLNELSESLIGSLSPSKVFLLDIPVEMAIERLKKKNTLSKYDKVDPDFMENQRKGFLKLAKTYKWIIIDGSKPVDTIKNEIVRSIDPLL